MLAACLCLLHAQCKHSAHPTLLKAACMIQHTNRRVYMPAGVALRCCQVDTTWRDLMEAAQGNPSVLGLAQDPERLARLQEANAMLEEIQKVRTWQGGLTNARHALQLPAGSSRVHGCIWLLTRARRCSTRSAADTTRNTAAVAALAAPVVTCTPPGPGCVPGAQAAVLSSFLFP